MITEDSVLDAQNTPQGIDALYVHNHVLSGMVTRFDGLALEIQQQSEKDLNGPMFIRMYPLNGANSI